MIAVRKTSRAVRAAMPAWLLAVLTVCLVIPGPFDEIAAVLALVLLCTIQPVRAHRAASAWRGGKSHRAYDVT
jgi:hypothetical protein